MPNVKSLICDSFVVLLSQGEETKANFWMSCSSINGSITTSLLNAKIFKNEKLAEKGLLQLRKKQEMRSYPDAIIFPLHAVVQSNEIALWDIIGNLKKSTK